MRSAAAPEMQSSMTTAGQREAADIGIVELVSHHEWHGSL